MNEGYARFYSAWARAPMVRLALPFMAGITLAMAYPPALSAAIGGLALASLLAIGLMTRRAAHGQRWSRGSAASAWFVMFGMCWQVVRDPLARPDHASRDGDEPLDRIVRITAMNGSGEKVVRADGLVVAAFPGDTLRSRTGHVMLTLMRKQGRPDPVAGDELVVRSPLEAITRIPDPGGFDRRTWAASRGMYHELFAGPDDWSIIGHEWRWTDMFEPARSRITAWLEESGLPYRERALVKALVLGLRDELDHEQKDAFVRSGTIHVLAVSGTHVGFIYAMLLFVLGWWGGGARARIGRGILILLALWAYAGLTGACPSVLRATIMFSLFTLAGMGARRVDALNSLFAAALLLLLWEPHMLIEIGFQLSFLAVLGIILFHGPLLRQWIPGSRIIGHCWSLVVMSIAAQVLTAPLCLYLFKAFPVWFLPANLIVVAAAGVAVYGSVALLLFFRLPYLGAALVALLTLLLGVVDGVTTFFASLPGAYPAIRATFTDMLLLYALVLFMALRLLWEWRTAARLSLVTVVLLLAGWGYRAHQVAGRVSFTVYDDRHGLQASMCVGRTMVLLAADEEKGPGEWLVAKAGRHEQAWGLDRRVLLGSGFLHGPMPSERGGTVSGGGRWSGPGIDVYIHREGGPWPPDLKADVVVLTAIRSMRGNALPLRAAGVRHVVLAGDVSWKVRCAVRRWCGEQGVPCHDVREQGAFVLHAGAA